MRFPTDGRLYATIPGAYGTNGGGFPERELPAAPDPSVRRVAVLGDSMTYGTTTADETWTRRAEEALGQPWQFLNFAQYGYDVHQSAATLRHVVPPYAPDLVIYAAYANDVVPTRIVFAGEPALPVSVSAASEIFPVALRGRSSLLRHVEGAILARRVTDTPDFARFEAGVAAMAADAAALGAEFLAVTLVPHVAAGRDRGGCDARCEDALALTARQEAVFDALGVAHGSVLGALRCSGAAGFPPQNPDDWEHPSPAGQHVVGLAVADLLRRRAAGEPLPRLDDRPCAPGAIR